MKEIFKDILWYEWLYQVSNLGRIKSFHKRKWKNIILKQLNIGWYKRVILCKNLIQKRYLVHRLIAQAFIPNIENKPQINHKNWIRNDNRIENLEWTTQKENMIHRYKVLWYKGIFQTNHPMKWKFGKEHNRSKLAYTEWGFYWKSLQTI